MKIDSWRLSLSLSLQQLLLLITLRIIISALTVGFWILALGDLNVRRLWNHFSVRCFRLTRKKLCAFFGQSVLLLIPFLMNERSRRRRQEWWRWWRYRRQRPQQWWQWRRRQWRRWRCRCRYTILIAVAVDVDPSESKVMALRSGRMIY